MQVLPSCGAQERLALGFNRFEASALQKSGKSAGRCLLTLHGWGHAASDVSF